jgi:hypothetical protein
MGWNRWPGQPRAILIWAGSGSQGRGMHALEHLPLPPHTRIVRISDGACLDGTHTRTGLEQHLTDIDRFDIPPTEFPDSTTHTHTLHTLLQYFHCTQFV